MAAKKRININVKEAEVVKSSQVIGLEEVIEQASTITMPSYSGTYELSDKDPIIDYYGDGSFYTHGKMYKIDNLQAGDNLSIKFYGMSSVIDTVVDIFGENAGVIELFGSFYTNNCYEYGEQVTYTVPTAGTYYIFCSGYSVRETGWCNVSISKMKTNTLQKVIEEAQSVSHLNATYTLGEDELIGVSNHTFVYGKMYKVKNLKAGDNLLLKCYGESANIDTQVQVGISDDYGNYPTKLKTFNNGTGERVTYTVPANGTYYIFFRGCDTNTVGECRVSIQQIAAGENATLDFTKAPLPTPTEDDLWSWDNQEKTLTLKDGFTMLVNQTAGNGIVLPDDSTIVVEGEAFILTTLHAICAKGDLKLSLASGSNLSVESIKGDGMNISGSLTVEEMPP